MKDNFSKSAEYYANYRPLYPTPLYEYIMNLCEHKVAAWDCGTGNGQVAMELSKYFQRVYATDISEEQIQNAFWDDKISYNVEAVESCTSSDRSFDLIVAAQSIHWFNFDQFYTQVRRTLRPKGLIAIIGYDLIQIDEPMNSIISDLYLNILGPYWDQERKYLDEKYQTIPFPFNEIESPSFTIELEWSLEQLIGYLQSWSAVQHYITEKKVNPIQEIQQKLAKAWGKDKKKKIEFPVFLRLGKRLANSN